MALVCICQQRYATKIWARPDPYQKWMIIMGNEELFEVYKRKARVAQGGRTARGPRMADVKMGT